MRKTTDAISNMVQGNPLLTFGLTRRIFNLTRLAKYLKPLLELRTKKELSISAITMALSRLQKQRIIHPERAEYFVKNITLSTGWQTFTYPATANVRTALQQLHAVLEEMGSTFTMTQGTSQTTLFVQEEDAPFVRKHIRERPLYHHCNIAAIAVPFSERFIKVPGLLSMLLEQIALQNINLIEINSTFTEFVIYVANEDARLAFETLYALVDRDRRVP